MTPNLPYTRDLVLIGGGHTHALVLRKWGMKPLPGTRVTLINPGPTAPYSGMLPGFVAGHYSRDALDIDLVKLARFAGARLVLGAATHIDPARHEIHVAGRAPIGFDVAAVDVGITSAMPTLPGFAAHGVPAKPLGPFATAWEAYLTGDGPARVAVIGAGVAGAELAMAMKHALRKAGRGGQVNLIDRSTALTALPPAPRRKVLAALDHLGITLIEHAAVAAVNAGSVELSDGRSIPSDFTTGAAGAKPYDWLARSGLDCHDGFLVVDDRLRTSDRDIFAVGDCAHMAFDPRPKAGVYAVRQAPVLFANLRAALSSEPWRRYRPQKDYLKLISLGGRSALAEKAGVPLTGPLMWRWKDHIDRTFMDQFATLRPMPQAPLPYPRAKGPEALSKPLCTGCGGKVGRDALSGVMAAQPTRADVTPLPGDDAAVLTMGGTRQVLSTDHISAVSADPGTLGRIAAVHALGDIWAMGASPQAALMQVTLPRQSPALQARALAELHAAAQAIMAEAGADIIGGHTTMGAEMQVGFTVTGLCDRAPITLSGARPGDALILTKPLGTGVLLAAEMQMMARGAWIADMLDSMMQGQSAAARVLSGAHAMTDVTGFGLAGHLEGMMRASGTGVVLTLQAIPLLDGAAEMAAAGVASSLYQANRDLAPGLPDQGAAALLFDPQTAGGLLAAVPADQATRVIADLHKAGFARAAIIGQVTDEAGWLRAI